MFSDERKPLNIFCSPTEVIVVLFNGRSAALSNGVRDLLAS
jgi:hypothetical protein